VLQATAQCQYTSINETDARERVNLAAAGSKISRAAPFSSRRRAKFSFSCAGAACLVSYCHSESRTPSPSPSLCPVPWESRRSELQHGTLLHLQHLTGQRVPCTYSILHLHSSRFVPQRSSRSCPSKHRSRCCARTSPLARSLARSLTTHPPAHLASQSIPPHLTSPHLTSPSLSIAAHARIALRQPTHFRSRCLYSARLSQAGLWSDVHSLSPCIFIHLALRASAKPPPLPQPPSP
jgi:hypothetical protein